MVPLMCCGGADLCDFPACVGASWVADLSRMGSDLGGHVLETFLERV